MSVAKTKPIPDEEIKIEEEGFVTPSKAISLPGLSLSIWVATMVFYQILVAMDICPKYTSFCFFISLLLSFFGALFVVQKMKTNATTGSKIFLILMNTFVIYTSANGIQAGNAFLSKAEPGEICKASVIPFLSSKPWLPDKESRETISLQADTIASFRDSLNRLNEQFAVLMNGETNTSETIKLLLVRVDSLQNQLDTSMKQNQEWTMLKMQWANAPDNTLDSFTLYIRRQDKAFPRTSKSYITALADYTAGEGFYKQMFEK